MNEKVRNIVLLLALVIVLVIFVDLIFNFSGLMVEKFTISSSYNEQTTNMQTEPATVSNPTELPDDQLNHKNIKSVLAKFEGKMLTVVFLKNDPENSTILIESPVSKNANISVNSDGTLSEELKTPANTAQQFKLIKIDSTQSFNNLLNNSNNGAHTAITITNYPFYILKSVKFGDNNWCLAYEPGRLYLSPLGNYNNQKWDVSNIEVPNKSVTTHNVNNNAVSSFNTNGDGLEGEIVDPNKIKINLNLTDELKRQLLGVESNNNNSSNGSSSGSNFYSQKCDTHIPKNALSSLCRGCDATKL